MIISRSIDHSFLWLSNIPLYTYTNSHTHTYIYVVCVCMHAQSLSLIQLFAIPWIVACQAPLSIEFSRQQYWSRLPFPSPGDLSDPGMGPAPPALADRFFTTEPPGKLCVCVCVCIIFFIYSYGTGTTTEI